MEGGLNSLGISEDQILMLKGERGAPGPVGPVGPQGDAGAAGYDGVQGRQGDPGIKVITVPLNLQGDHSEWWQILPLT